MSGINGVGANTPLHNVSKVAAARQQVDPGQRPQGAAADR